MRFFTLVLLAALAVGCDDQSTRRSGPDKDGVTQLRDSDKEMNAAVAEARARLPQFHAALKAPAAGSSHFSIKARFDFAGGGEHIWIGDVSHDGKQFTGRVENVPQRIKGMKLGDTVSVADAVVSDWLYVEDGRLVGAYTLRVIYRRMSPPEQQAFRQQFPHKIDW